MAIQFSGEFGTPRSPEEVFDFLSDPNQFAPLLPDFQSMSMQDPTHFTVKVRVGVGNIRGTAEIKMELAEAVKPQRPPGPSEVTTFTAAPRRAIASR